MQPGCAACVSGLWNVNLNRFQQIETIVQNRPGRVRMLELFLAPAAVAGAQPETVIVQPEPLPPGVRRFRLPRRKLLRLMARAGMPEARERHRQRLA